MPAEAAALPQIGPSAREDHRIVLRGVDWSLYEQLLQVRGESPVPRISYCEGTLELMSSSKTHERIAKTLARLLEMYALSRGIHLYGLRSWTIYEKLEKRGIAPDECYSIGKEEPGERPDLAIEVVWTSGGIDKLGIYSKLGVREVWFWQKEKIAVYGLRGEGYVELIRSELLPGFDIEHVLPFLTRRDQTVALLEYWAWLQENPE